MIQALTSQFFAPTKALRRLSMLQAIHASPESSQHALARKTCLSSSMVNNYIRELKETGLIHMSGDTNRTVRYHLTPKGRVTLMQTLLGYSAEIVQLYAAVKREVGAILQRFYDEDIRTVVLYGVAETAEVVYAALKQTPLVVIGVVDSDSSKHGQLFDGYPVQAPEAIEKIIPDAVIITSFAKQEEIYASLNEHVGADIKVRKLSDPQKGALCAF